MNIKEDYIQSHVKLADLSVDVYLWWVEYASKLDYKKPKYNPGKLIEIFPEIKQDVDKILLEKISDWEACKSDENAEMVHRLNKLYNLVHANPQANKDGISDDMIQQAKDVDWELVVDEPRKSSGGRLLTKCLWHDDSQPSMVLYPGGCGGYCFVCNKGIDTIEYVMKANEMNFIEAVKYLSTL